MKILVVDDEEAVVEFVASLLGDAGHEVLRAYDGRSAFEIARDQRPDLIVTDIMMPIMNGMELCQELHAASDTSHIPIILMTAGRRPGEDCPGATFLAKPFDIDTLEDTIASAQQPA